MKRGGRWLITGLTMAVLFAMLSALLPGTGVEPAAAQSVDGDAPPGSDQTWPDLADRTPPGDPDRPAPGPSAPDQRERAQQHIINGSPIAITERPWHVLVSDESFGGTWCGGSILAANLILTAAHCVDNPFLDVSRLLVVAGSDDWRDLEDGQWIFAKDLIIHPSYDPSDGFDGNQGLDLALIELARPLTFDESVQPIEVADPAEAAAALGGDADLAGWGVNTLPADDGSAADSLLNGSGEVVSDTFCGALIGRTLNSPIEICLDGIAANQTGCYGDSGGGMTMAFGGVRKLLGVASFTVLECSLNILVLAETTTAAAWIEANTPPITTGSAFVNGRVWNDADFDSVEDPDEVGLAGIEVALAITPPSATATSPVQITTFTDADGRYSFEAPFGGWYDVTVTLDPLTVPSPPNGAGTEATNTDSNGRTRDLLLVEPTLTYTDRFLLTPGSTQDDIDVGATPGTTVAGVIFDDLDRNGRRDTNEPASSSVRAFIDIYRIADNGEALFFDTREVSELDSFAFAVPPGEFYVEFYDSFTDRRVSVPGRGDESGDNDFSPFTNRTDRFIVQVDETYVFDLGLTAAGSGAAFVDVANTDCDGTVSIIDALVIAQYTAGIRTDGATCPLPNPATQINVANADMNLDGITDIIDALLVSQCDAGLATPFCAALD